MAATTIKARGPSNLAAAREHGRRQPKARPGCGQCWPASSQPRWPARGLRWRLRRPVALDPNIKRVRRAVRVATPNTASPGNRRRRHLWRPAPPSRRSTVTNWRDESMPRRCSSAPSPLFLRVYRPLLHRLAPAVGRGRRSTLRGGARLATALHV
jgi:hypothetical protein